MRGVKIEAHHRDPKHNIWSVPSLLGYYFQGNNDRPAQRWCTIGTRVQKTTTTSQASFTLLTKLNSSHWMGWIVAVLSQCWGKAEPGNWDVSKREVEAFRKCRYLQIRRHFVGTGRAGLQQRPSSPRTEKGEAIVMPSTYSSKRHDFRWRKKRRRHQKRTKTTQGRHGRQNEDGRFNLWPLLQWLFFEFYFAQVATCIKSRGWSGERSAPNNKRNVGKLCMEKKLSVNEWGRGSGGTRKQFN